MPSPIPAAVTTTIPFPSGSGGTVQNPMYYDTSGTTVYPANNAASGTTTTISIAGQNDGSFPSPSSGGTTIGYVTSSISSAAAITFSGSNPAVTINTTSADCYINDGSTYYADLSVDTGTSTVPITSDIPGKFTGTNTLQFELTSSTNQDPGSPSKIKLEINKVPKS